jgi:ATP phosphoribosyltransferase
MDLPTYVEHGAADVGIIGKDVLLEEQKDVYELLDLRHGLCRLVLAAPETLRSERLADYANMRVATKYPRVAAEFFHNAGLQAEIITLNGSIELAPMVGLSELIVDIVETGRTLRENKLAEISVIEYTTARLIANRASFKLKFARIYGILAALRQLTEKETA